MTARDVGILFKGRLVRSILRELNPKTATRRLMNPQPPDDWTGPDPGDGPVRLEHHPDAACLIQERATGPVGWPLPRCPYGGPGRRLWVRETWRPVERDWDLVDGVLYKADDGFQPIKNTRAAAEAWGQVFRRERLRAVPGRAPLLGYTPRGGRWRPAIHMPRWACRVELEVASIRAERLQAMTTADAYAEGLVAGDRELHGPDMARWPVDDKAQDEAPGGTWANAVDVFAGLWDSINETRAPWASNPWVWVIEFRRVIAP